LRPLFQPFFGPAISSVKTKFRSVTGNLSYNSKTGSKNSTAKGGATFYSDPSIISKEPSVSMEKRLVIEKRQSFELQGYTADQSDWDDMRHQHMGGYR
jgi:hypothetical protein